jgi:hypothetical protein
MKKYDSLFKDICTIENFRKAFKNAIRGKRHYPEVRRILRNGKERYLWKLLDEVKSKKYRVSEYKVFNLYTGHKWREIYKLPMKDRIVQHAIMNYLEPIFRETFILDTYSSIKTRGIHMGLQRVKKALRKYDYKYYAKLDVHKCYPSLDKNLLKQKLALKFQDDDLLWLLYTIIDSCEKGVPIGNYTSQYFNNFYFSSLDHYVKEALHIKGYFRYCDDIIILGSDKQELHAVMRTVIRKIEELGVHVKANWQIYSVDVRGVDFLGYIIRKSHTKVRKQTKHNFIRKVSVMDFGNPTEHDINVLGSYWGILSHADCRNLWFRYTHMKKFQDLGIKVHEREFVRNITGIPLTITKSHIIHKNGRDWLRFECNYTLDGMEHSKVLVSTSGEVLVEAAKRILASDYPFEATILINDKGFYEFN